VINPETDQSRNVCGTKLVTRKAPRSKKANENLTLKLQPAMGIRKLEIFGEPKGRFSRESKGRLGKQNSRKEESSDNSRSETLQKSVLETGTGESGRKESSETQRNDSEAIIGTEASAQAE
jgi:hypothetical protein